MVENAVPPVGPSSPQPPLHSFSGSPQVAAQSLLAALGIPPQPPPGLWAPGPPASPNVSNTTAIVVSVLTLLLGVAGGGAGSTLFGSQEAVSTAREARAAVMEKLTEISSEMKDVTRRLTALEAQQTKTSEQVAGLSTRGWTRDDQDRYAHDASRQVEALERRVAALERGGPK